MKPGTILCHPSMFNILHERYPNRNITSDNRMKQTEWVVYRRRSGKTGLFVVLNEKVYIPGGSMFGLYPRSTSRR